MSCGCAFWQPVGHWLWCGRTFCCLRSTGLVTCDTTFRLFWKKVMSPKLPVPLFPYTISTISRFEREIAESHLTNDVSDKGNHRHYMIKEIYEQPVAIQRTLDGRISNSKVVDTAFGAEAPESSAEGRTRTNYSPAVPATTPAWRHVTGLKTLAEFPVTLRLPLNIVIENRLSVQTACW